MLWSRRGARRRWVAQHLVLAASLVAAVTLSLPAAGQAPSPVPFVRHALADVPKAVADWAEGIRQQQGTYRLDHGDRTYLLIAWGEKPTGGHGVTVERIEPYGDDVYVVSVALRAPGPYDVVTMALTYPFDLVSVARTPRLFAYTFSGAPWAREGAGMPGASRFIFVEAPDPGATVNSPLVVRGTAQVYEATFTVELEDGHDVLARQVVTASEGGSGWGTFEVTLTFLPATNPSGMLLFSRVDADTGARVEELAVPVRFAATRPLQPSLTDVAGHWAEEEIGQGVALGFIAGYPDGSFRPQGTVTRAEFVKMLLAALGRPPLDRAASFADTGGHWAAGLLERAVADGIVRPSDYLGGKFDPDRPITRLEIAMLVVRALGLEGQAPAAAHLADRYPDGATLADWARGYVGIASDRGIVRGYPDGHFYPGRTATRAEAVVMVNRTLRAGQ